MKPEIYYIKEFEWLNFGYKQDSENHPISNKYYLGLPSPLIGAVTLVVDSSLMISLPRLKASPDDDFGWSGELIKITRENVLDHTPTEQDLDYMNNWTQPPLPTSNDDLINDNRIGEAIELMSSIHQTNEYLFDALLVVMRHAHLDDMQEAPSLGSTINLTSEGKGVNCKEAITAIEKYLSDTKVGDKPLRLLEATTALIKELQRRDINEQD